MPAPAGLNPPVRATYPDSLNPFPRSLHATLRAPSSREFKRSLSKTNKTTRRHRVVYSYQHPATCTPQYTMVAPCPLPVIRFVRLIAAYTR